MDWYHKQNPQRCSTVNSANTDMQLAALHEDLIESVFVVSISLLLFVIRHATIFSLKDCPGRASLGRMHEVYEKGLEIQLLNAQQLMETRCIGRSLEMRSQRGHCCW